MRLGWLRIEADPLAYSNHHSKAYSRPSEPYSPSNWFQSKNGFVSGLGFLGIKQGQGDPAADGEGALPKARRKRIVKTKVAS